MKVKEEIVHSGRSVTKTRNWAGIVYPESAPTDWREKLANLHMKALTSPVHDRDVNNEGELVKPHIHVVLSFDGPVSQKIANGVFAQFCGTQSAEYIRSLSSYARYLAHLDSPDKAQYDPREIDAYGGMNLTRLLAGEEDRSQVYSEICDWCANQGVTSFAVLVSYARLHRIDWFPAIVSKAYFFKTYLQSLGYDEGLARRQKTWREQDPTQSLRNENNPG